MLHNVEETGVQSALLSFVPQTSNCKCNPHFVFIVHHQFDPALPCWQMLQMLTAIPVGVTICSPCIGL